MSGGATDPARADAIARVETVLTRNLPGHAIGPIDHLKTGDGSTVCFAEIDKTPVVVKSFTGIGAAQTVQDLRAELDLLVPTMSDGPYQVNRVVHAFPSDGVVVLTRAPGAPLNEVLRNADAAQRAGLLEMAGRWLARYQSTRRKPGVFGPGFWLERAKNLDAGALTPEDRVRRRALLARLREYVVDSRGHPITRAATHGDFVSMNLSYDGAVLCGVDIQGTCWQAAARDVARFLVWEAVRATPRSRPRRFGIDRADLDAVLASGVLDPASARTVLPVFIGAELLDRFIDAYGHPRLRDASRLAIDSYAADL